MSNILFETIMEAGTITAASFFVATISSIAIGIYIAFMANLKGSISKSMTITLALIPAVVQLVIMLVNGNIGAGIAVAGAFSLVRFRSMPGSGQDITNIFLAMAVGLATGMGYIGLAVCFALIVTIVNLILKVASFGGNGSEVKMVKITVPESLDFEGIFDDIFARYTTNATLREVKTTEMGSLYKLTYDVCMRKGASTKAMIDEMRQRNGNLEISFSRPVAAAPESI
jgi:hypothetical protein